MPTKVRICNYCRSCSSQTFYHVRPIHFLAPALEPHLSKVTEKSTVGSRVYKGMGIWVSHLPLIRLNNVESSAVPVATSSSKLVILEYPLGIQRLLVFNTPALGINVKMCCPSS